jgi:hypothetical protein
MKRRIWRKKNFIYVKGKDAFYSIRKTNLHFCINSDFPSSLHQLAKPQEKLQAEVAGSVAAAASC